MAVNSENQAKPIKCNVCVCVCVCVCVSVDKSRFKHWNRWYTCLPLWWLLLVQMLVHGSEDFPDETAVEKVLPVGRELLLRMNPTSGYCTQAVRQVAPSFRQCVFQSEMKLKYFPVYSETNCITECHMDSTIQYCNCSHFYYHDTGETLMAVSWLPTNSVNTHKLD